MKIIYITNSRVPTEKAYGYQISKMCEEFADAKNEVELWTPVRQSNIKEDIFSFYNIKNNFKIKEIKSFDFLRFHRILGRIAFWLHSLFFLIKLSSQRIDKNVVVYTRNAEVCWFFNLKKIKTVYEAHSWPESKIWLHKFFVKKADKIVVITKAIKKLYINIGFIEDEILLAPDGVDLEKFNIKISSEDARKKLGLPLNKIIIMYTGHLYEWKGAQILADSASFLEDNNLIVFVGGTEYDLNKFKKRNNDHKNILIVGHVKHEQIPNYLKSADVLILPNSAKEKISSHYTSPLKLFEYMASQRPIVASNLPSIKEILSENNAILVKPDSPEDLGKGIMRILQNKELSAKISSQAFRDVESNTWKKRANIILSFIKE